MDARERERQNLHDNSVQYTYTICTKSNATMASHKQHFYKILRMRMLCVLCRFWYVLRVVVLNGYLYALNVFPAMNGEYE